ncbi:polysaccharide pyruvyl transferase family protein [Rhodococcus sp. HNM0569]|uniref:polysaccharide pyruvyl transferase family protein n=1 Tax=Rhodococcus sp. HNM0569 TaxID=2716340 RepID=UPI001F116202|nr:polysaccharide pyruvyl transferase family protein [Rhodococcus sp. HNM0569]
MLPLPRRRGSEVRERELIYLVAPSGAPNYGDEFILRGWLRYLAERRPDADVVVDCHTPGQAAVLHSDFHPRVVFVDTIWRMCDATRDMELAEGAEFVQSAIDNPGVLCRMVTGIEMLIRADVVHFLGGGYLNSVWPHHITLLVAACAAAEKGGGRLVATGQGLFPVVPGGLPLLRELVDRFDMFDVRDTPSQLAAGDASRVRSTGDDAWLAIADHDTYDSEAVALERDFVLCVQSDLMDDFAGGGGLDALVTTVTDVLRAWGVDGRDVAVVEGMPGTDRVVFDRIEHEIPEACFVPFTDVWRRGLPARPGQVWASTRFHPHLVAAAIGASGTALGGRRDYYATKHRSLVDSGSNWVVSEPQSIPGSPVRDGGFTVETVHRFHHAKMGLADEIYPRHPRLARRVGARVERLRALPVSGLRVVRERQRETVPAV